jgi:hypothetical protein
MTSRGAFDLVYESKQRENTPLHLESITFLQFVDQQATFRRCEPSMDPTRPRGRG